MSVLSWLVLAGWTGIGVWFCFDAVRFARAGRRHRSGEAGGELISSGHGLLLALCRVAAGLGLIGVVVAVVLGAPVTWAVVGGPVVMLSFGLVGYAGTRRLATRHGTGS